MEAPPSAAGDDAFPAVQLALLALVRVAEPIALTSVFPYAYKLVLGFHFGAPDYAAAYAGILIAAFSFAESFTGIFWGSLSDRVGRRPVLLLGCVGTLASLLVVGLSDSFWMALAGRVMGGALNGNVGVVQTMVGELVTNPKHEPKAYAIMPFVWSVGAIIGPAVGGYFAEPAKTFPHWFSKAGLFGRYPFLLPNVICSSLLLLAVVIGVLFIHETHPDLQSPAADDAAPAADHAPLYQPLSTAAANEHAPANLSTGQYGTFHEIEVPDTETWEVGARAKECPRKPRVYTRQILLLVTALGLFTYVSMTYDHLMPIFLQYPRGPRPSPHSTLPLGGVFAGGLGVSTQQVGLIMSVNGLIALLIQGVLFPWLAGRLGIWRLFVVVTIGHPIAFLLVPGLVLLPTAALGPAIYAALAVRNVFSILAYPLLLVLVKEACPASACLGQINGLAASVAAAARCLASPVSGWLFSLGAQYRMLALPWLVSAGVAVLAAAQVLLLRRQRDTAVVHSIRHQMGREPVEHAPRRIVHVRVLGRAPDETDRLL